jgi:3-hydroxyisobutyrate dehydrogenase-like beta-hydroxyacid dehydrogenase
MTAIGFIGLGQMGAPMAKHLVGFGDLVVCDARAEATDEFSTQGVAVAASPAEVASKADVISVMVLDDEQVREVVTGADGIVAGARPNTVVAVHSTIRAGTAETLAAEIDDRGIAIVDAPVSGGFVGAHKGTLAVMVGGPDEAVERCREPFGRWATLFVHVGPTGAGTRAKLARNLLHFIAFTGATEAQRLADAAGIDLGHLRQVVLHSDAVTGGPGAIMFRGSTARVTPGGQWYDTLLHVRTLGEKDLALAIELGKELGVELPLAELSLERFAKGLGIPHDDTSNSA